VKERAVPQPVEVLPRDAHNAALVANVHPPDWKNPVPDGRYNLVVIGAGTAGLITSLVASSLGAKVALVERHLMGGDCLNVGCVPSKALIRAAHMAHEARGASRIGLGAPDARLPDFGAAMERMREIRARISHDDAAKRYTEEFGVEIFFGSARFTGPGTLDVDGTTLEFAKAVIASGARAAAPPVPGLAETGYLDNETVFALTERPRRLAVIGAGPIGCELAQAFRRLGSEVTLFETAPQILTREDPDAAAIVQRAFVREGIELVLGCTLERVEANGAGKVVHVSCPKRGPRALAFDEILVGAGRAPNVEGLGLEAVGVEYDAREGIRVDDFLRTTNPRIFAAGDCAMAWKFTHAADAAAKIVVQNALFSLGPFGRKRLSRLVMPWCTYTDPEIAHVGLYEREAKARGIALDTYQVPIERANRAVTDGQEEGLVKIHVKRGTGEIVGASVVAAHAGDLITQLTLAITQGIPLGAFTNLIYPYPTQGEAIKAAAGLYTRTRLTPRVKRLFTALMRLRR
jgi:pyruvate/2-oxoglutarate dehydrogenase complex dihydrolipoamide dehydrogenase (E3) component